MTDATRRLPRHERGERGNIRSRLVPGLVVSLLAFFVVGTIIGVTPLRDLFSAKVGAGPGPNTPAEGGDGALRLVDDLKLVEEGRTLFLAHCATCHGLKGDRLPVAPLSSKDFLNSRGDATLLATISQGKGIMPAWGRQHDGPLADEQIQQVLAYLNATAGRSSPSLQGQAGQVVFQQQCVQCHGARGDRVPAAPLAAVAFLSGRTDAQLVESISRGTGAMPPQGRAAGGPLNNQQIRDAVAYLRFNAEATLAATARRGRELYVGNCLACHGERGDRVSGVALASADHLRQTGEGALISAVAEGQGVMPGFARSRGGLFELQDIAALLTYLKTWAGLPAGSALAEPGKAGEGSAIFARNCLACHGGGGDQVAGVALKSAAFLGARPDDQLARAINQGNTRGMPAFGQTFSGPLSDADVRAVIEYLRSAASSGGASVTPAGQPGAKPAPTGNQPVTKPAADPAAKPAADPAAAKGQEIFGKNCVACHGAARDQIPTAKLADGAWLAQRGDAALTQSITGGKGGMPAWSKERGGTLGPEDIQAVLTYLKSVAQGGGGTGPVGGSSGQPAGGQAVAKPAADGAAKGKEIFGKNCVACHGAARDQVPTAKLAESAWLGQRGDAALTQSITGGKGPMPAWGKERGGSLSPEDIQAVLAYLKSEAK